jgi:transcription initiation factor TFIID subunit 2
VEIKAIAVDKWPVATFDYSDPYKRLKARDGYTVYQHHLIHEKLEHDFQRVEPELTIPLPRQLRIQPQPSAFTGKDANLAVPLDPTTPRLLDDSGLAYQHFTVYIDYVIKSARDGLHWVGLQDGDQRYPHVYTHNSALFGPQSCFVFPCVDAAYSKHTWRFTFNCPRTLADLATPARNPAVNGIHRNGKSNGTNGYTSETDLDSESLLELLSEEEKGLDVSVVCSGYMEDNDVSLTLSTTETQLTEQAPIEDKATRRKWVFYCNTPVPPRHVGFTIGPFEELNLSEFRESEQDDKLGQSAVSIHGFCLPGRADEMRNTCMPLAMVRIILLHSIAHRADVY